MRGAQTYEPAGMVGALAQYWGVRGIREEGSGVGEVRVRRAVRRMMVLVRMVACTHGLVASLNGDGGGLGGMIHLLCIAVDVGFLCGVPPPLFMGGFLGCDSTSAPLGFSR